MTTPTHTPPDDEPGPVRLLAGLFLTQLLAVIAIAAVLTVVVSSLGGGLDDDVSAGTKPADRSSATAESPPTSTPSQTPPASASSSPPPATTSAPATVSSTPPSPPVDDRPRVDVVNQSAPDGAARVVAGRLRERGWPIGRIEDFSGNVAETTVYYPPGMRRDARLLANDLPGSLRVLPGFSTISGSRLTVILVD